MSQENINLLSKSNNFTVDASFIASFFLPDEKVLQFSDEIFKQFNENKIIFYSSSVLIYEVGNVFTSSLKRKRLDINVAKQFYKEFLNLKIIFIEIEPKLILEISNNLDLTFYDASYVYISQITGTPLLSYDKKLLSKIK
ncbi:MAG: type II toxin-antitoxin system VapC family toxin [Patescibacteria group bacterium]